MKFLSLFAGIGGFDLGLERVGMECVGQVEIDKKCQLVLAKHWPNVKRMSDIREVKGDEFGTVDLICGGFPCQPFSTAGKRKGDADNRYLWPEMVRVIANVKPTWVLGENVAGIVNMALDKVPSDLEGLRYTVQSFIIPACAVNAPHRRDYKGTNSQEHLNKARRHHDQLPNFVKMYATPQSRDFRIGQADRWDSPFRSRNLNDQVGGKLSVIFVEWLMGYPEGWTDLSNSETRSSRKSSK